MARAETWAIAEEKNAFAALLPTILPSHEGEIVVFHHGEPFGFFPTYELAYAEATKAFGVGEVFLITRVEEQRDHRLPIALQFGLMFR